MVFSILFASPTASAVDNFGTKDGSIEFQKLEIEKGDFGRSWDGDPFFYSMDFEFFSGGQMILVTEWPTEESGKPVVTTWRVDGRYLYEVGSSELPGEHSVVYNAGISQYAVKLAIRDGGSGTEVFVARSMSQYEHRVERYLLDDEGVLDPGSQTVLLNIWNNASSNWVL